MLTKCYRISITCTSNGKCLMSISHVDLSIAGGIQRTSPSFDMTAIVSRCSFSRVSALANHRTLSTVIFHFRFVLFIFVLFICQFSFWDRAEDYLCFYSIDQSIIYLWNINSQNSDTSQYTSSTGLQDRKACTDRSPLNRVGQKQLLFFLQLCWFDFHLSFQSSCKAAIFPVNYM